MRYITFFLSAGFAGMYSVEFAKYSDDVTDQQLEDDAWGRALNNAESYGVYPEYERSDDGDDEDSDNYTDNIEGYWEEYDSEKHDGFTISGTVEFEDCTR